MASRGRPGSGTIEGFLSPTYRALVRANGFSWIALGLCAALAAAAAWRWTPLREWAEPERLSGWLEAYRTSWFALPLTVATFVVLGLVLFPVLALIFACGIVFGPVLGTLYALSGSLSSALVSFFLGRRIGRARLERWGGALVRRLEALLEERGLIAVYLVRKIPAPFTLVNLVCGASPVRLRDFLLGTLLGMVTGIALIAILGWELLAILRRGEPGAIAFGLVLAAVPLGLTLWVQRLLVRRSRAHG